MKKKEEKKKKKEELISCSNPTLKYNSTSTLSDFESQWPSLAAGYYSSIFIVLSCSW